MQYLYEKMRQTVSRKLGFRIRSKSDCRILSSMLSAKEIGRLSESTLYRFFIADSSQKFYPDTLNKLAIFVGNNSWDDFCNQHKTGDALLYTSGIISEKKMETSLIKTCVFNQAIKPLYDFFEKIPYSVSEYTVRVLVAELFQSLYQNKKSNFEFYSQLGGLPFIRNYFFEVGADPDFKIHDYEIGLQQYLIHSSSNLSETRQLQDFIFVKSLLFRHYFLKGDALKAKLISKELFENPDIDPSIINNMEVFPASRWYAYRIWWAKQWRSNVTVRVEEEFLIFCKEINRTGSYIDKQIVCYNALDVLKEEGLKCNMLDYIIHLFSDIIPIGMQGTNAIPQLMRLIEPNGIKRF